MAAARKRATVSLVDAIDDEIADQAVRPAAAPPAAPAPAGQAEPPQQEAETRPAPESPERPPPAEQPKAVGVWDARMSLTLSKPMKRSLDMARADDGIEGTARIRAMIALWEQDERIRRRIDKMAKSYR
jgi:hypothetical protein